MVEVLKLAAASAHDQLQFANTYQWDHGRQPMLQVPSGIGEMAVSRLGWYFAMLLCR